MAGGDEDGLDCIAVEPTGAHVTAQLGGGLVGRQRVAVRTRLAHRLVRVGGAEHARQR